MSQPANDDFSQHLSDDEASYHKDASENGTATNKPKQQQQQLIPTTTTILNIKLLILKKEEYDIWAMEMEHYLKYIDNDVWKVIQNENSKKRISTGKDGVVRILSSVSAAEIHAVEKERKARTILLMAIPKEHLRRFHGMDSKKMQKVVLKQQFEAFNISSSEGLEKGYDRFQQLLSQLEAHGAEVSTEDANHKFLRSLPPAWSNLAMTMRTKPDVDTLSIDDLYNNLRVFEQELTSTSKSSTSAQNVAFLSNTSRAALTRFGNLLNEDLEQIDDVDIEEMDINWQIAIIAIRMKKFYKKTGRRVRIDGNKPVGFDKKKLECFKCHNTGHFARECTSKGTNDGNKRDSFYQDQGARKKEQNQNCLLIMDDGVVNWGEHTVEEEETNHALMAISSNNEANEIYAKDEKLKRYRRIGMKAVKEKEQLQKTLDSWKDSSKNLWRLINSGMSSNSKVGLGYEIQSNNEVLSYEEEMNFSVFNCSKEDSVGKPLYSRFTKTNDFKGVPHPLSGDYTPTPQEEIDESLYVYGKKGPQEPEPNVSDDRSSEYSTCQSNDSAGSIGTSSKHSVDLESEISRVPPRREFQLERMVLFEYFHHSEGLEKGYDRFQQLLSQLKAHGAEVSTEDANHKFLRSLPSAWSNLAMTMRTKPNVDTLSIDDLYNNLRVFEQEIQGASKTFLSAQNVVFVSQSKSSTNKVDLDLFKLAIVLQRLYRSKTEDLHASSHYRD
ncbi:ribonuclease H-like domain-containing protein [Tanacetum coccineum]